MNKKKNIKEIKKYKSDLFKLLYYVKTVRQTLLNDCLKASIGEKSCQNT